MDLYERYLPKKVRQWIEQNTNSPYGFLQNTNE